MWMNVKDLSEYLGIKVKTLYAMAIRGNLPFYKIGKLVRFKREEIDAWMETKRAESLDSRIDKISRSLYTPNIGRPGRLKERKVVH